MLTAETLTRHELIGLHARVTESSDPTLVGCEGTIAMETRNTLTIADGSRTRQVPKAAVTLEFALSNGYVTVSGERLLARPARRTERSGGSQWQ